MARSSRNRATDIRSAYLLAGECRELGDEPKLWREHYARGLSRLIGCDLALVVETRDCLGPKPVDLGVAEWGWENGYSRTGWAAALAEFERNPQYPIGLGSYIRRLAGEDGVVHTRLDLVPDREWQPSFENQFVHRSCGFGEFVWCFRSIPGQPGVFSGVMAAKPPRKPDFNPRERAALAEAQRAVALLVGGPLSRFSEPSPLGLPPRVRQVLKCFLEGDSDKQAAARLGISRFTVNEYAKQIHRHFGVSSRAELLARWVRRGWGANGGWVNPAT
jgi:DNA-binding CsgD family transcriptional regulator